MQRSYGDGGLGLKSDMDNATMIQGEVYVNNYFPILALKKLNFQAVGN